MGAQLGSWCPLDNYFWAILLMEKTPAPVGMMVMLLCRNAIHRVSYILDGWLDFFHQQLVMCILPRVKSDCVIVTACGGADTVPTEVGWGCPIVVHGYMWWCWWWWWWWWWWLQRCQSLFWEPSISSAKVMAMERPWRFFLFSSPKSNILCFEEAHWWQLYVSGREWSNILS